MRPRLLVLASTYPATSDDGVPAFVRDLAMEEAKDFDTVVLVPAVPGAPPTERLGAVTVKRFRYFPKTWEDLAQGAILENVRTKWSRWLQVPPFLLAEYLAVRREVRRNRPDVLHVHWLIPQGAVALASARGISKLVTTLGGDLYGLSDPMSRRLIRRVLADCAVATTMNEDMRARLIELGADPDTTQVIPMGADLTTIRPLAATGIRQPGRVLFVGRLVEKKGLTHLLAAIRRLDRRDVEVRVVGDGPLRSSLQAAAADLPVTFVGSLGRTELAREYGSAALAVFPSVPAASGDQDGLPVALLEAMGTGCPVVVSRLPGLADAVVDGVSGLVVEPGADREIADAVRSLLDDPGLRDTLGAGAAVRAEDFSTAAVGDRYRRLLNRLVAVP